MHSMDRKEAIRQYKERKPQRGAFAVHCTATGHAWVGSSPNVDSAQNGLWFALRANGHLDKLLQGEWNQHGEAAFQYEVLEKLDDDVAPIAVRDLLKEKRAQWAEQLQAKMLL